MKKIIGLALAVAFVLCVDSVFAAGKTIVIMSHQTKFHEKVENQISANIEKKLGIKIEYQVLPDGNWEQVFRTKLAAGDAPDLVIANAPPSFDQFEAGTFVDLAREPWVSKMVNPKAVTDPKGRVYAQPRFSSGVFILVYYNKKIFKELNLNPSPTTYKDFLANMEKVKKSGKYTPIIFSNKDKWSTQIFMLCGNGALGKTRDPDIFKKIVANKLKWVDFPEFQVVMAKFKELFDNGYANKDSLTTSFDDAKSAFGMGKAAMILNGDWTIGDFATKYPGFEAGAFAIPFIDKKPMVTTANWVDGIHVVASGKQVDLAKKVLVEIAKPENYELWAADTGFAPAFTDCKVDKQPPVVQEVIKNYIKTGNYVYQQNDDMPMINDDVYQELWSYYIELITGDKTPLEVAKAWDAKFEEFFTMKGAAGW